MGERPGNEVFSVSLAITVEDRQGILADITSAISNLKTNIRNPAPRRSPVWAKAPSRSLWIFPT